MVPTPLDLPIADVSQPPAIRAPARERWSWAIYDFANTIFSMNVATYYFGVWLVSDLGSTNTVVAIGNSTASMLVALSIPVLGAISDARQRRVPWVIWLTLIACASTAFIGVIGYQMMPVVGDSVVPAAVRSPGWHVGGAPLVWIIAAFVLANYTYQGALPFYNAMLPELVPIHERGRLSGLGVAIGYVGSIAGIVFTAPFFNGSLAGVMQLPATFIHGIRSIVPFTSHGGRVSSFVPTAILYLLFSLPLFVFCRDHHPIRAKRPIHWREAFASVFETIRHSRRYPGALRFILASFLYQDAMGTIISFLGIYAVEVVGFSKGTEITLFIVLIIPGVLGSYLSGVLVDRIGAKRTTLWVLVSWVVLLIALVAIPSRTGFWVVGSCIGFIFGGLNTSERPLLLSLIPDVEAGRFFGLMVLSARAAAVVGPLIFALIADGLAHALGAATAYRIAVMTITLGFVGAFFVIRGVPDRFRHEQQ
ncbi:MAG: MFS transporter [Gemmatimonadaceae bacterium]